MGYFDDIWNRATDAFTDAEEEADRIYDEAYDTAAQAAIDVTEAPGNALRSADRAVADAVVDAGRVAGESVGDFIDNAVPRDLIDSALTAQRQGGETIKWYVIGFIALSVMLILGAIGFYLGPMLLAGLSRWETVV